MPLASTFYGMTEKGFSMTDVLREINQRLKDILPVGVFCCATIVEMNFREARMRVWNGGLPDAYIYRHQSGEIEPVASTHLPLGVVGNKDFKDDVRLYDLAYGDRFYMWSDGIHEARNHAGEMFGEQRLKDIFYRNYQTRRAPEQLFDEIISAVQVHIGEEGADDDLSVFEVIMSRPEDIELVSQLISSNHRSGEVEWILDFEVKPSSFRVFDPMPLLLNLLLDVPGLRAHSGDLYTVLAELYSNALEHGVLQLDSAMKQSAEGFVGYYAERERRLEAMSDGYVRFHLEHHHVDDGGVLQMRVEDSGEGYDVEAVKNKVSGESYCGRGIKLIESLCDSLEYRGRGNIVEAVFRWGGLY